MIELGLHTDNWRPLSLGHDAAIAKITATGIKHIEFCGIHGQNFIAALGHDPGVSLQSNPRATRRDLDQNGLKVSQIDGSDPMMGPNGSAFGMQYSPVHGILAQNGLERRDIHRMQWHGREHPQKRRVDARLGQISET